MNAAADWSQADNTCLSQYRYLLDIALRSVDIPIISSDLKQNSENVIHKSIDRYYDAVTSCVRNACAKTIPLKCQNLQSNEYIVPGWNDYINDKHDTARAVFRLGVLW